MKLSVPDPVPWPTLERADVPLLQYDAEQGIYMVPRLRGHAFATSLPGTSSHTFTFEGNRDPHCSISVVGNRNVLEIALQEMYARPVPHSRLRKQNGDYLYEPWGLLIVVDETHPGTGSTWKADLQGITLKLNRLRNFRAFLELLREEHDRDRGLIEPL